MIQDRSPRGRSSHYDYIVIGAGSAGSVIASRLTERPEVRVLLLEAGGRDSSVFLRMPLAFRLLRSMMLYDWGYQSEPEPHADGRIIAAARGRVLGGSSSVNGLMYSRGHPRDYDQWAQLGATGWAFDDVLPYFKRSESNWRGETDRHGGAGPLSVAQMPDDDMVSRALHRTAQRLGHRVLTDFEADTPDGFALPDLTIAGGRRASASQAYLEPARRRPNLKVVTSAHVARVVIEKSRAVGVEYIVGGERRLAFAGQEVVISGGAFASPQILMLSGIGPADHLREHGIAVTADLPGVGRDLQDHPLVPMGFKAKTPFAFGRGLRADRLAAAAIQWRLTGTGFAAGLPLSSIAYYRSRPDLERPDLENIFMPTSLGAKVWFPGLRKPVDDVFTSLNVALRPQSRGRVSLRSSDPLEPPKIVYNLLSAPEDLAGLRHTIRWTRDLLAGQPIADHVGDEIFPGVAVAEDAALDAYIRRTVVTAQHPTSTCRMGADPGAVVDPQLRVRGLEGLRVADASVMPVVIGGHTNAPAIMIGEKAADLLLANL